MCSGSIIFIGLIVGIEQNEHIDTSRLETYQICELPKIANFRSIKLDLVSGYDGACASLMFENIYKFNIHGVPEDDYEAEPTMMASFKKLRQNELTSFLTKTE